MTERSTLTRALVAAPAIAAAFAGAGLYVAQTQPLAGIVEAGHQTDATRARIADLEAQIQQDMTAVDQLRQRLDQLQQTSEVAARPEASPATPPATRSGSVSRRTTDRTAARTTKRTSSGSTRTTSKAAPKPAPRAAPKPAPKPAPKKTTAPKPAPKTNTSTGGS